MGRSGRLGDEPFLALSAEAVAIAADLDDGGVVHEAVEHGGGEDGVTGEGLVPGPERQVRGEDDRALLVAARDDLEQEIWD